MNYDSTLSSHDVSIIFRSHKIYTPWIYWFHIRAYSNTSFYLYRTLIHDYMCFYFIHMKMVVFPSILVGQALIVIGLIRLDEVEA
jgi:hypothetical protein